MPPRSFGGGSSSSSASSPTATSSHFSAIEGHPYPDVASTLVEGAAIGYGGFAVRSVVEFDVDGDADRDALVELVSPAEFAFGFARRENDRFVQSIVMRSARPAECTLEAPSLRVVAADVAVATRRMRCPTGPRVVVDVVRLGEVVRPGFAYAVEPPPADDPFVASLTVTPRIDDVDADGSNDVVLDVETVARVAETRRTEHLVARNTASGFAFDPAAVASRAQVLSRSAARDLRRQPARALRDASAGLAFVRAVCPDEGAPLVTIREAASRCGDRASRARFGGTIAVALAALGRVDALAAWLDTLEAASIPVDSSATMSIADAVRTNAARKLPSYLHLDVPSEVSPTMSWGFDASHAIVATGIPTGRLVLEPSPSFVEDPSATAVAPARSRRFGDSLLARVGERAVLVAIPIVDGGSIRECVLAGDARAVLCRGEGTLRLARLEGPP